MITLATPFANKQYCFEDYYRGILNLDYPKDDIHCLWYDNSNDKDFHKLLGEKIKVFKRHQIVVDETPHMTIENTTDYGKVSYRVAQMYMNLEKFLPESDYTFIVEDDVEIPPDTLTKLLEIFTRYPKVGTAVGSVSSRRMTDSLFKRPVAWWFEERRVFPFPDDCREIQVEHKRYQSVPPFGIRIIGTAHTGCWLAPTHLIKKLHFGYEEDGVKPNDARWGWVLQKAGYYMVMDWSVVCKHWWICDGEKGYY